MEFIILILCLVMNFVIIMSVINKGKEVKTSIQDKKDEIKKLSKEDRELAEELIARLSGR